jgi:DNA-binding transcriptional regulator GbsR (MarR family)
MPDNPQAERFVQRMGLTLEELGATRTAGRLIGVLLLAERPLALGELAAQLQASKASISTNARYCQQLGMVQRVSVPGDRRDYYEIRPGSFENMVVRRIGVIHHFLELVDEGEAAIDASNDQALARLHSMRAFYTYFLEELQSALERWRQGGKHMG